MWLSKYTASLHLSSRLRGCTPELWPPVLWDPVCRGHCTIGVPNLLIRALIGDAPEPRNRKDVKRTLGSSKDLPPSAVLGQGGMILGLVLRLQGLLVAVIFQTRNDYSANGTSVAQNAFLCTRTPTLQ